MEAYSIDFLKMACSEHEIQCSRLTKKEMFDALVSKGVLEKCPYKSPLPRSNSGRIIITLNEEDLKNYTEKFSYF